MLDLSVLTNNFNSSMINISIASLYIFCGFVIGRFAGKFFGQIVTKMHLEDITKRFGVDKPGALVERGVSSLVYIIAIILALQELSTDPFIRTILIWTLVVLFLILCILVATLSFKEVIPNLVIGFYLRVIKHLKPQDKIKLAGVRGVVKNVGLFETEVLTSDKEIMFFPNSYFARRIKLMLKR